MVAGRRVFPPALAIALLVGAVVATQQFVYLFVPASTPNATIGAVAGVLGGLRFLLVPVGALALGYVVGRTVDVPGTYTRLAGMGGLAGLLGVVPGYLLVAGSVPQRPRLVGSVLLPVVYLGVTTAVTLAVAVLAGAALAHFRADETG